MMLTAAVIVTLSMGFVSIAAFLGGAWFGIACLVLIVVVSCAVLSLAIVVVSVDRD